MKIFTPKILPLLAVLIALSLPVFAKRNGPIRIQSAKSKKMMRGGDKGNGGDMCENRILNIQSKLKSWISSSKSEHLQLEGRVSLENYKTQMLDKIKNTKVSCTPDHYFVEKGKKKIEKTCKTVQGDDGIDWILCNFERFNNTPFSKQYRSIHHEDAVLAELEKNKGIEKLDYWITDQVVGNFKSSEYIFNPNSAFTREKEYNVAGRSWLILYTYLLYTGANDDNRLCTGPDECIVKVLTMTPVQFLNSGIKVPLKGFDMVSFLNVAKFLGGWGIYNYIDINDLNKLFKESKTMLNVALALKNSCSDDDLVENDGYNCSFFDVDAWAIDRAAIINRVIHK